MSLRINHNTTAINAHRNLQTNDVGMAKTLEKLSSGLKINRAADGPAALVISEQMRGQIAGLNQAIDNSETAISMVQTAEANLSEVSSLLTSVRQLAIHAANEGVNDELMLEADQKEISNALETIDRIARQSQFGTKPLLDGSNGALGSTTGEDLEFIGATLKTADSSASGFEIRVTQTATKSTVVGSKRLSEDIVKSGETLTVIENGKKATYTTNADDTTDTAIQNLRSAIAENGLNVSVSKTEDGLIKVEHNEYGTGHGFQVSSSTAGVLSAEAGEIETAESGVDVKGTINGESAVGKGQVLTGINGASNIDGLSVRFTGEIDKTPVDEEGNPIEPEPVEPEIGPNGEEIPPEDLGTVVGRVYVSQNSLNFHVGANRGQTVGIAINATDSGNLSKGVDNESGFRSLKDIDVRSFNGAQDAIKMVDEAIDQIASARGDLGAFQKNTLESNLNNLRVANENLVSSESVIRDADMAKEMADFTKGQIMTQSATAMLAQGNQMPRNVLQLLG